MVVEENIRGALSQGSLTLAATLLSFPYTCTSGIGEQRQSGRVGANELELLAVCHASFSSAPSLTTTLSFP